MTERERQIYGHQIDLERAFMQGFMASNKDFNGEVFVYDKNDVMRDGRFKKALEKFKGGSK